MEAIDIRKAAAELRGIWVAGNEYLQEAEPWAVFKTDPEQAAAIIASPPARNARRPRPSAKPPARNGRRPGGSINRPLVAVARVLRSWPVVAVARALITQPRILLADEPTGALDSKTSDQLMDLLIELNDEGVTVVVVTHEADIAAQCQRTIVLVDGEVAQA